MAFSMKLNNLYIMAKQTAIATGSTIIKGRSKKTLTVEYRRFEGKGGTKKETFSITVENPLHDTKYTLKDLTLNDLKKIVELAEGCIESTEM